VTALDDALGPGTAPAARSRFDASRSFLVPAMTLVGWAYLATMIGLVAWVVLATSLTGWDPMVVSSGSMRPALSPGDVVMIGDRPSGPIGVGTVVSFRDRNGMVVTHRVAHVDDDGTLRTRGDASSGVDGVKLAQDDVLGVGRFVVPFVGTPVLWLRSGAYGQLALVLLVTILDVAMLFGPIARRVSAEPDR
jgi:signal peptidase